MIDRTMMRRRPRRYLIISESTVLKEGELMIPNRYNGKMETPLILNRQLQRQVLRFQNGGQKTLINDKKNNQLLPSKFPYVLILPRSCLILPCISFFSLDR